MTKFNDMEKDCPYDAWQLIQAKEILKWLRSVNNFGLNSTNVISSIEDVLFNMAYNKLGLKPISKCSIQELQEELKRRGL